MLESGQLSLKNSVNNCNVSLLLLKGDLQFVPKNLTRIDCFVQYFSLHLCSLFAKINFVIIVLSKQLSGRFDVPSSPGAEIMFV